MRSVHRTKGIRKMIRIIVLRKPVQKYVTAGDRNCRSLARESRSRRRSGPSDSAILAWAGYELAWEMRNGFWESRAA